MRIHKRLRWLLPAMAVMLLVGACVLLLGRWYLRREFASRLAAMTGAPVVVGQVDLGVRRQRVWGIELRESGPRAAPWLTAERIEFDLSLWDALKGRTDPSRLLVGPVTIALRIDEQGKILTRLPTWDAGLSQDVPFELLDVIDARIEIQQQGRNLLNVQGIQVRMQQVDAELLATGTIKDLLNAGWSFEAKWAPVSGETSWSLSTERLRLDSHQVMSLPLMPADLMANVRAQVTTPLAISGSYHPRAGINYRVELAPRSGAIEVAGEELVVGPAGGQVVVEDHVLTATDLNIESLGGSFTLAGRLDCRHEPWHGRAEIACEGVVLDRLPELGTTPLPLDGILAAQVDIDVELGDGQVRLAGDGDGTLTRARFLDLPVEPIEMKVTGAQGVFDLSVADQRRAISGHVGLNVAMTDVSIGEILPLFDLDSMQAFPVVEGRLSIRGSLETDLPNVFDPLAYDAKGVATIAEFKSASVECSEMTAEVDYARGKLKLDRVRASLANEGQIRGKATVNLADERPVIASEVEFTQIPGEFTASYLPEAADISLGPISGRVKVTAFADRLNDSSAWRGGGELRCQRLHLGDEELADVTTEFQLDDGTIRLSEMKARWLETELAGSANLHLDESFRFDSQLSQKRLDLATTAKAIGLDLPDSTSAAVDVTANLKGTLRPIVWEASGVVKAPELSIADFSAESFLCTWRMSPVALELTQFRVDLLGGHVQMAGAFPLDEGSGLQLEGTFGEIDGALLTRRFAWSSQANITGPLSGSFRLSNAEDLDRAVYEIQFGGVQAKVRGLVLQDVTGDVAYHERRLRLTLDGSFFDGSFEFWGDGPISDGNSFEPHLTGRLEIKQASLARVAAALDPQLRLAPLRGRASGNFDVRLDGPRFQPEGEGRLRLDDVTWDNSPLATEIRLNAVLEDNALRMTDIAFAVAGGTLSGTLTTYLDRTSEGDFAFDVDRVSLEQLPTFWRKSLPPLTGYLNGSLRGRLGNQWQGSGQVKLVRGSIGGVSTHSLRAPFDWTYAPNSGSVQARVRLTTARIARGRAAGELDLRWSGRLDLEGSAHVTGADMRSLAKAAPDLHDAITGRLSGSVRFKGTNVRSLDNVAGTFQGTLVQSQALALPVLQSLTTSLGIGSASSETFSKTEAKGRFHRGIFEIDRMTMESPENRLFIDGKMTTRGQLDLDVTADTSKIAAVGIVLGLLRPIDFLRRRLIFLHIGGSLRSPSVQPRTAEFIEQEIQLFFLPFALSP